MVEEKQKGITRRTFFRTSSILGAGLLFGFYFAPNGQLQAFAQTSGTEDNANPLWQPNAFICIKPDNTVTVIVHKSEMGQGIHTALLMLIVEELEASWDDIRIESAPAHPDYNHTLWKVQGTGASTSISSTWKQLRLAGATVREMLIAAAAETWKVSPKRCLAEKGYVLHLDSDQRLSFGCLSTKASQMPLPENVILKKPEEFKVIGKSMKRLGNVDRVEGKAVYGIDVKVPGMLTAVIERPPVFGGQVQSFDATAAKAITGVKYVVAVPQGVAVVAENFWLAQQGRAVLEVEWDEGINATLDSKALRQKYADLGECTGLMVREEGDVSAAFETSVQTLEAVYEVPYLAHTPMEPLNCIADVRRDSCEIWTGTQMQTTDQSAACAITGLKPEQVQIHTTLLGSSFGRRSNPHADYVKEAVEVSKAIGYPVKVMWSREDDVRGGFYRPMHYSKIAAGLDQDGNINAWFHRLVGESIGTGTQFEHVLVHNGVDHLSVEGASDHPYNIPNQRVEYHPVSNGVPVLWWRSVGHSFTSFIVETFIDELAVSVGRDSVDFRLSMLADQPRHRKTLELVAEKAGWGQQLPDRVYRGLALHPSFGSIVAQVAEVSVGDDGKVSVERVVCAVDCGIVINPDTVIAQVESGIVYGLSAALYGEITFENGRVQQSNFHDYPVLRINEMPRIEVHLVNSLEKPSGVGEIGTPPIAPAVCNAIFAATGKRIRKLPICLEEL